MRILVVLAALVIGVVCSYPMDEKIPRRVKRDSMTEYSEDSGSGERLPLILRPLSYAIQLQPHIYDRPLDNFTFDGTVKVEFDCLQDTRRIVLHAKKIDVPAEGVIVQSAGGEILQVEEVTYNHTTEFLTVVVRGLVRAGQRYLMELQYSGKLEKDLHGMYVSEYDKDGEERYTVITQLEPTDARKVFPCWDEPGFKAVFNITIIRRAPMASLSNTMIVRTERRPELGRGWLADVYESTPYMSTYLVAVSVHDFINIDTRTKRGTLLRAWAPAHKMASIEYGLSVVKKSFDFFEEYTGIQYPMHKLDQIAVKDFAWGGMENWGLIVYSNSYFFYDPDKDDADQKRDVSLIVNHEIAHQWFGNLVTCKWWDELWLNEGFTSYMENFGMENVTPDLEVGELRFRNRDRVMKKDGMPGFHAVKPEIITRGDIMHAFGMSTYNKGAEVVRMLKATMGEYAFKTACRNYLQQFKYRSVDEGDLFRVFTQTIREVGDAYGDRHMNIRDFLLSWVEQNNYPLVTITRDRSGGVHFYQQRFLADKTLFANHDSKSYRWRIPLFLGSNKTGEYKSIRTVWLNSRNGSLTTERLRDSDWILGNAEVNGYYRVNYDEHNWQLLSDQLSKDHTMIPTKNRAQLLDDVIELGKAGLLDGSYSFSLGRFLQHEREYLPWKVFLKKLSTARELLAFSPVALALRSFMLEIIEPIYQHLTWEQRDASSGIELIKIEIFKTACQFQLEACEEKVKDMFRKRREEPIPKDFKKMVYCAAVAAGTPDTWLEVVEELKTSEDFDAIEYMTEALTCTKDPALIARFLNMSVSLVMGEDSVIDYGSVTQGLVALSRNPQAGHSAWKTFLKHFDIFKDFYFTEEICKHLGQEEDLKLLQDFRKTFSDEFHDQELDFCAESIAANYKWSQSNVATIGRWLRNIYG